MRGLTTLATVVTLVFGLGMAVWWLEERFGSVAALALLLVVLVALLIGVGWLLSLASARQSLTAVTDFNQMDAQTDRYRQQTVHGLIEGEQLGQRVQLLQEQRLNRQQLAAQQRLRWEMEQRRALSYTNPEDWDGPPATRVIGQNDDNFQEYD